MCCGELFDASQINLGTFLPPDKKKKKKKTVVDLHFTCPVSFEEIDIKLLG